MSVWGKDKLIKMPEIINQIEKHNINALHIHHTWKPSHKDYNDNLQQLQNNMRSYHMNVRGWTDIANHLTLSPDGLWITGRPFGIMPCSIHGKNSKYVLAVEMIGDFDNGQDILEGSQKNSLLELINYFVTHNKEIVFHNEYSNKTCPGTSLNKQQLIHKATHIYDVIESGPSEYAKEYIKRAKKLNITDGTRPKDNCTREEVITIIMRALEL